MTGGTVVVTFPYACVCARICACVPVYVGWTDPVWACAQFRGVVCPNLDVEAVAAMDSAAVLVTNGQRRPC